jgi:4a-hydroxytetrahydrobiopterin dehydratase
MNLQEQISRILKGTIVESKNWGDSDEKLEKNFKFKDFNESMDFVNKVAKIAEEQQHHPDIEIKYNKVKISITDHEKGGVSDKCHKLVKSIDDIEKMVRVTKSDLIRIIKQEEMKEGELTEKCWTGYTQKGMKTMFGKQYPNCVKKTK